jgi:ribosomal protein S18 acetylase RimI-like enzyme
MFVLEQITSANAALFKSIRLEALRDSPLAFGSTYANESRLSDGDWLKRAAEWSRPQSRGILALNSGAGCGICAVYIDEEDPRVGQIRSMWVAPKWRRNGVGRTLLAAAHSWAKAHGAESARLTVTNCNTTAIRFYEKTGYRMTGKTLPYPNDPALFEHEMECVLGAEAAPVA